ncbi:hypothetical protein HDF26_000836 [Pedobacter cryoconitis]|uniref:Uncharacterized protein n=1 Tax=Pedobacter cryoconitis TaxID=188932 RepID=A0A7W8ZPY2_9SPHI|nr:hypothetical protein [Pedobacter cryoconitis]MBB5637835.1 hypothetical protein [Pedobacter cryoconitis]MBB6270409.1 hypothetical protein [Pedobacter cryoconitis]
MYIRTILLTSFFLINVLATLAQEPDTSHITYRKPLFDFNPLKPTFKLDKEQLINKKRFLRFSLLTGYREGVVPIKGLTNFASTTDVISGIRILYMYNLSIQDMLTYGMYQSNRVVLEVKDPSHYHYDPTQGLERQWLRKNAYCFELALPIEKFNSNTIILDELSRIFGVECGLKKRLVNALVLVRTSEKDKIKSKGIGVDTYDKTGHFNNISIADDRFGDYLYKSGMPPVVDETDYKGPVDMDLNISDWTNLAEVRKALNRYDLDLKEEKREVLMFVITELNNK